VSSRVVKPPEKRDDGPTLKGSHLAAAFGSTLSGLVPGMAAYRRLHLRLLMSPPLAGFRERSSSVDAVFDVVAISEAAGLSLMCLEP
jgi:hypothetical protein